MEMIVIGLIVFVIIVVINVLSWYRIVPPSEVHLVITPNKKLIVSSDDSISKDGKKTYFEIPKYIPFIGRIVRKMDLTIKELITTQETYEVNQARFSVKASTKYRVIDVLRAAETFTEMRDLEKQLNEVIQAAVRAVTVKYDVVDARGQKTQMEDAIRDEVTDDLAAWGLELVNFQLVDFSDTADSTIISDISKRREVEISATTREQNAEKMKQARIKEAEADEKAQTREIERDRVIGEQEQLKAEMIATKEKVAEEQRFQVVQVQTISQAEIDKEKAIVEAKQSKETEEILRDQKKLEGEGDRLREEQRAKGSAAPIREKYLAEAEGKEKLQEALNKFTPAAITALTAELIVNMQKDVGIATANALQTADMKVFAGGTDGKQAFDLGQLISAAQMSNDVLGESLANKIARPNDLGFSALGLQKASENKEVSTQKDTITETEYTEFGDDGISVNNE